MQDLVDVLEAARVSAPTSLHTDMHAWSWTLSASREPDSAAKKLVRAIASNGILGEHIDTMQFLPSGGLRTSAEHFAAWLIRRAQSVGAARALSECETYFQQETISGHVVMVLTAIGLEESHGMPDGTTLSPWEKVPDCSAKRELSDWSPLKPRPTAALIRPLSWPRIPPQSDDAFANVRHYSDAIVCMHSLLVCMQLLGVSGVQLLGHFILIPESAPFIHVGLQRSVLLPTMSETNWRVEWTDAVSEMYPQLIGHPHRETFELVAHRLSSALYDADSLVDRYIDLGIAMESLFLSDESQELTYRLKLRAARLVGEDTEDRQAIFKLVDGFYKQRSKAVHTGKIAVTQEIATSQLGEVAAVAGRGARRILAMMREPEWQKFDLA